MNIKSPFIMCVKYIGGYSLNQGVFSTLGEYHKYIYGVLSTSEGTISASGRGDIINTLGDVQYIGGYHDACGGIP